MPRRPRRRRRGPLPAEVGSVRERIEHWRATREKRTRMPDELWEAAATVAREHGLWAVSRALRVNYESLKQRVGRAREATGASAAGFVELDAAQLIGRGEGATSVLELSSADGAKLLVRLEGHDTLDVPALVAAFWGRGR